MVRADAARTVEPVQGQHAGDGGEQPGAVGRRTVTTLHLHGRLDREPETLPGAAGSISSASAAVVAGTAAGRPAGRRTCATSRPTRPRRHDDQAAGPARAGVGLGQRVQQVEHRRAIREPAAIRGRRSPGRPGRGGSRSSAAAGGAGPAARRMRVGIAKPHAQSRSAPPSAAPSSEWSALQALADVVQDGREHEQVGAATPCGPAPRPGRHVSIRCRSTVNEVDGSRCGSGAAADPSPADSRRDQSGLVELLPTAGSSAPRRAATGRSQLRPAPATARVPGWRRGPAGRRSPSDTGRPGSAPRAAARSTSAGRRRGPRRAVEHDLAVLLHDAVGQRRTAAGRRPADPRRDRRAAAGGTCATRCQVGSWTGRRSAGRGRAPRTSARSGSRPIRPARPASWSCCCSRSVPRPVTACRTSRTSSSACRSASDPGAGSRPARWRPGPGARHRRAARPRLLEVGRGREGELPVRLRAAAGWTPRSAGSRLRARRRQSASNAGPESSGQVGIARDVPEVQHAERRRQVAGRPSRASGAVADRVVERNPRSQSGYQSRVGEPTLGVGHRRLVDAAPRSRSENGESSRATVPADGDQRHSATLTRLRRPVRPTSLRSTEPDARRRAGPASGPSQQLRPAVPRIRSGRAPPDRRIPGPSDRLRASCPRLAGAHPHDVSTGMAQTLPSPILPVRAALTRTSTTSSASASSTTTRVAPSAPGRRVLGTAVDLGVTALAAVAGGLGDRHALDAEGSQGARTSSELERLDHRGDELHAWTSPSPLVGGQAAGRGCRQHGATGCDVSRSRSPRARRRRCPDLVVLLDPEAHGLLEGEADDERHHERVRQHRARRRPPAASSWSRPPP